MSKINPLANLDIIRQHNQIANTSNKKNENTSFKDTLKGVLNDVNKLQFEAKDSVQGFLEGEVEDVHDVMIAAEKASVGLELTLEVRNKLIEAYRDVMRMSG